MSLQTYISLRSYLSFLYLNRSSTLCRCRWQIDGASSIVFKYSVDSIYCWLLNSGNLTNFEHDICLQIKANPLTRWALLLDKIKIMKLQHVTCFFHFNSEMWFYCSKVGGCRYINSYDFFFIFLRKKIVLVANICLDQYLLCHV